MSQRSTQPSITSDIIIPNEFKDFNVLPDEMRNEIASYLFSDDNCPLEAAIKKQIKPKSKVILEFQHSFDKFNNIYKTKSYYFLKIPNFTLLFAATCLGLPLKNYRHIPMNFIQSFLESLNQDSVDEGILDVIIPFTIYRVPYEEDQLSVEKLILYLAKFFTPSIFLRHLLNCLEIYIRKDKILPFHIDTISLVYDKFNIDASQSRDIERIILRPLENTKDKTRLELSCSELRKKIQLKLNDRSFNNSASSSEIFSGHGSPISSKRSVQFHDTLTILLDEIENGQYGSPTTILIQVKDELVHCNEFPHRSPEPLLALAFRTYPFQTSSETQNAILSLIFQLNSICDPFILLKIYLQIPSSLQFQGVPSDLIERCYKDFLDRRRNELDRTPNYPENLFANFNNSLSNVSPRNVQIEPKKNTESKDIDSRLEIEFRHLTNWDTAYDAVCAIWELIGRYKNEEIRDLLLTKFDDLEYAPKSFLVQGLRELEDQKPRSEDTETTIRQLEDYFVYYMKPGSINNSNASISRSTSPRILSNAYQSDPQKTTPVSSSARLTPQDQLKRKRVTPNNNSLRSGYKTNH